jgi:hypothetical protein
LNHLFAAASDTLENVSAESKAFKLTTAVAQKERPASIVQQPYWCSMHFQPISFSFSAEFFTA